MKNIVLIDRYVGSELELARPLSGKSDIEIVLLVVDNESQKLALKGVSNIKQIVTVAEIDKYGSMDGLDYKTILDCRMDQVVVENALTRFESDYNIRKYVYYCSLSFWNKIFSVNKVDVIFVNDGLHGLPYDGLLKSMAKKYNAVMYTSIMIGVNRWARLIFNETNHCLEEIKNNLPVENVMYYLKNEKEDVLHIHVDGNIYHRKDNTLKSCLKRFVYFIGGALGVEIVQGVFGGNLFKKRLFTSNGFYTNPVIKLKCYLKVLWYQRYLKKCEVCQIEDINYIFFPLHIEPEATTQCRLTMESQLIVLKMLSESVPEGWMIYVKEHPYHFKMNTMVCSYFLHNLDLFKTKKFYQKIASMKNVKLISHKISSDELVKKSRAVASLMGSVFLEATLYKKPILMFSEYHPLTMNVETLNCFSYSDCQKAIDKIKNGFIPTYSDILGTTNRYICSSATDFINNSLRIINRFSGDYYEN